MPVITIAHNPQLTKEQVRAAFERQFSGKYRVEKTQAPFRDFQVVMNAFVAVAVKLEQTDRETKFVYGGLSPSLWARLLLGQFFGFVTCRGLTHEVEQFIRTAPDFAPSAGIVRVA